MAGYLPNDDPQLRWVERVTKFLDSKYRIPGTSFRFGLDPIIGLIPGVGDAVSLGISGLLVITMSRHGASGQVVLMMLGNVLIDTLFGSIPILGNIFDFYYKANQRNINLLRQHYEKGKYSGSGRGIMLLSMIILLLLCVIMIWLVIELIQYLIGLF